MNSRLLAIGAVWMMGCASAPTHNGERSLRVMSYNIEYGHEGLDSVAAVIRDQHPDIVGLQEVDVHWSERSNFADQAALPITTSPGIRLRTPPQRRLRCPGFSKRW